jgi:hypothetical protein
VALRKEKILPRQSIWDIAIIFYGAAAGIEFLILDNPTVFNLETTPVADTIFYVRDEPINKAVVEYFAAQDIKPGTAIEEPFDPDWILWNGVWNDDKFWKDNALWID